MAGSKAELGITIHHHRESGGPGQLLRTVALGSRFRGNDGQYEWEDLMPEIPRLNPAIRAVAVGEPIFVTFWN